MGESEFRGHFKKATEFIALYHPFSATRTAGILWVARHWFDWSWRKLTCQERSPLNSKVVSLMTTYTAADAALAGIAARATPCGEPAAKSSRALADLERVELTRLVNWVTKPDSGRALLLLHEVAELSLASLAPVFGGDVQNLQVRCTKFRSAWKQTLMAFDKKVDTIRISSELFAMAQAPLSEPSTGMDEEGALFAELDFLRGFLRL